MMIGTSAWSLRWSETSEPSRATMDHDDDDDDDAPRSRSFCVDCSIPSPPTSTSYTLISASFGWRLTRDVNAEGLAIMEWRCPSCWEAYKKQRGLSTGEHSSPLLRRPKP